MQIKTQEPCADSRRRPALTVVLLWAALLLNGYAYAACGPIPNTYPLYGGSGFTTDNNGSVNGFGIGNPGGNGIKVVTADGKKGVDANGNLTSTVQSLPSIAPATFVASGAAAGTNTSTTIAAGDYDKITKPAGGATTFTGGIYHINVLGNTSSNVDNWTITLAPGDYYIDKLDLHDSNFIVLSGSGVVRLYIKTYINVHNQMELNNGGTTQNLQIYLYPGATAVFNDKTIFNGLMYAPGNTSTISFHNSDNSHTYTGAIITGGTLDFNGDEVINYNAATQAAIGAISTCGAASASISTAVAVPNLMAADNTTLSTITVTLKNSDGNLLAGKTVTLAQTGSSTISAASGPSNASGVVTFTVKSAVVELVFYTATVVTDGITLGQKPTVKFTVNTAGSSVVASPTSVPADGVTTSTITVSLKDGAGNPLPSGRQVRLAAGSGSSTILPSIAFTNGSGVVFFTVKDTVVESVTYTATDQTNNVIITQTATVNFTPVVASFNVVEPMAHHITGKIYTKIAGQNFALDIVARKSDNTIATGFTGTVTVEVVDNSGGGACGSLPLIGALTNQIFVSGDNGRHVLTSPNTVANVYRNAVVRVKFPTSSPTVTSCSTDNFAIRPAFLSFAVTDGSRTTAGTTNTLNNTALAGATVHNAGRPFTITATAYNGAGAPVITSNYNGSPTPAFPSLPACVGTACTAPTSGLSVGTWSGSGTLTTTTATYDEVGAFMLQLEDATFASVDTSDAGISAAQYTISSTAAGVGRFVPDRFLLSAASLIPRTDIPACAGSSFTYMDERMNANFTLTAVRFPGGTTTRYAGALARLDLSSPASFNFGAIGTGPAGLAVLGTRLVTSPAPLGTSGTWSNGVGAVVAVVAAGRNASPDGPYSSFKLGIAPADPDAVALDPLAINVDADNNGSMERAQIGAATDVRFGRLRLQNANGSQLIAMPIPISAQYWNGSGFITNMADNCTTVTAANIAIGNPQNGLTAAMVSPPAVGGAFILGIGSLRLPKPAGGARGSVDVAVNLTNSTTSASCTGGMTSATGANMAYLQGAWCGATYVNDPTARATFGTYRNTDQFIYQRENY